MRRLGSPLEAERGGERTAAVGCVAGSAIATAGSWLRFSLAHTPAIDTHTWSYVLGSALAGMGLVLAGVCALRLAPRAGRLSGRCLWATALGSHGAALLALPLTSTDVFTCLSYGALQRAGLSPYTHPPAALGSAPITALVPERWAHSPTPYGPLFHPLVRAAAWAGARLGSPVWGSLFAYKLILLVAMLAALALAAQHLRATRAPAEAAETFALLALNPLLTWEVVGQGHNDGLLFLALVAFVVLARRGRSTWAVIALTAGVAVKYTLAPLLGLYLVLLARRSIARALALGALALALVGLAFLPEGRGVTLSAVLPMVGGESARHAHSLTDLVCLVLEGLSLPRLSFAAYRLLSLASALVCAALLLGAGLHSRSVEELAHRYLLFLLGLFLTVPWFQPWYVIWALPLLLALPDRRWRFFLALFAVVTVSQWAVPLDPVTTVLGDTWAAWQAWRLAGGTSPGNGSRRRIGEERPCGYTASP